MINNILQKIKVMNKMIKKNQKKIEQNQLGNMI